MSAAVAQLKSDVTSLEAEHDALVRTIARKHQELDSINTQIKAATDRLDKIKAEIAKVKAHLGVSNQ
jgi:septal ring factor EnvC (AmiA/AmiB activator)